MGGQGRLLTAPSRSSTLPVVTVSDTAARFDATCCCCSARRVIVVNAACMLLLAVGVACLGFFVNERVQGWHMRSFNLLGWMCVGLGGFIGVLALLGLCAARSESRIALVMHFMLLLLLISALLLVFVYAVVENGKIGEYLKHNWDTVKDTSGVAALADEDADNGATFEETLQGAHKYLAAICAVGIAAAAGLLIALVASMRLLGVRMIAMSFLVALGLIGGGEVTMALLTRGQVPRATTWLLLGCAGVQIICSAAGICGFKRLNCECLFWSCLILLASSAGLAYVSVATYAWLVSSRVEVSWRGCAAQCGPLLGRTAPSDALTV